MNGLPLREDGKAGFGRITFIIDPIILKYKNVILMMAGMVMLTKIAF